MRCEGCGASVFEGEAACAECGRELPTTPRVDHVPIPAVAPHDEVPSAPVEPEAPPEAARCAEHPETLSASTCPRCGRFCCRVCIPEPGKDTLCPACHRFTRAQQNPQDLKRISREVKASFFFVALVAGAFGIGLPLVVSGDDLNVAFLVPGGCLTFMLLLCAVVFAVTELRVVAWFAIVLEAIAGLLMFALTQGKCLSWPLIAFPILTVVRLRRWNALKAEAAQLSA